MNNADLDNEALKQRLRFQGGPGSLEINSRKRASDESDDSGAPRARSKLQEKNKMLASLLAVPCRPLNSISTSNLPTVRQMPDIPIMKQNQLASPVGGEGKPPTTPNSNIPNNKNMNNNNNSVTKNNNLKNQPQKYRQQNVSRQQSLPIGNALKQLGESVYIQQLQGHQQQMAAMSRVNVVNSQSSFDGSDSQASYVSSSPAITLAAASSSTIIQHPIDSVIDPELNDILDNLFEEGSYNEESNMNFIPNVNNNNAQLKQQEEMAQINKIQQSLMECEDEANFSGSPPAYPLHAINAQNARAIQQTFSQQQPPPGYNQRNIRLPQMTISTSNNNIVTNSNAAAVAQATNSQKPTPNTMLIERIRMQQQQAQQQNIMEKIQQRLLQQQENQSYVVTAGADQLCEWNA